VVTSKPTRLYQLYSTQHSFFPFQSTNSLRHSTALHYAQYGSVLQLQDCTFLPLCPPLHSHTPTPNNTHNTTAGTITLQHATAHIRAFLPYRTVPLSYPPLPPAVPNRDSRFLFNPNTWTLADIHPFPHQTRSSIAGTQVSANQTRYSPHCLHIPQKQLRLIGSYLDSEQNISRHTQKESFHNNGRHY
jgi:hypothetical protein